MLRRDFFKRVLGAATTLFACGISGVLAAAPGARVPRKKIVDIQLRKQEWMELDAAVMKAARMRLRNWELRLESKSTEL